MIDRKNSVVSIKKSALEITTSNGFIAVPSAKLKSNSTSSSDSASTSGSFNDMSVAPPGYNFCDDSVTESCLLADESGPHRELAVDVPDSFVGTIKQTPRYPPLMPPPSISTFKPKQSLVKSPELELSVQRFGSNNPFSAATNYDDHGDTTNGINTIYKHMQAQPQTPITLSNKVSIHFLFLHLLILKLIRAHLHPLIYMMLNIRDLANA